MIKIYRNIRKKLLAEGNTVRYLKYAIGEIVLVVIGILIALQINDWNDAKKNYNVEQTFYLDVLDDLEKDRIELNNLNDFYDNRIEQLGWLLKAVRHPSKETDIIEFGKHVEPLYYNIPPISYLSAFESAKSSGTFDKIKNKDLLKSLTQYYTEYSKVRAILVSTLGIIETQLEPLMATIPENFIQPSSGSNVINLSNRDESIFYKYMFEIGDERDITIDIKSFLRKPEFENYIIGDLGRAFNLKTTVNSRLEFLKSLENNIRTYLDD